MGLLGNILITFVLGFWIMVWAASVMGMGGPGASNSLSWIIQLLIMVSYPAWIFIWLIWSGKSFWGASPIYFLIGFLVIFTVLNAGMFRYAYNLVRGIQNQGYSVASNKVYFNAKPIAEADAQSFDTFKGDLSYRFAYHAWDNKHIYYRGQLVEEASGGPLEAIDDNYSHKYVTNGDVVIWGGTLLRGCNRNDIEIFDSSESHWARCGDNVYHRGKFIKDADAQSFTPVNGWSAYDKHRFYDGTKEADTTAIASSFHRIESRYYRDEHRIYYVDANNINEVQGADVSTFEVIDETSNDIRSDARDAQTRFNWGEKVAPR
jgi:hypothetical protein